MRTADCMIGLGSTVIYFYLVGGDTISPAVCIPAIRRECWIVKKGASLPYGRYTPAYATAKLLVKLPIGDADAVADLMANIMLVRQQGE